MPATPYDKRSKTNSETGRVRESPALFDLPEFDSLPATEGLSNLEALQLSQPHALSLLPALLAQVRLDREDAGRERFLYSVEPVWETQGEIIGDFDRAGGR